MRPLICMMTGSTHGSLNQIWGSADEVAQPWLWFPETVSLDGLWFCPEHAPGVELIRLQMAWHEHSSGRSSYPIQPEHSGKIVCPTKPAHTCHQCTEQWCNLEDLTDNDGDDLTETFILDATSIGPNGFCRIICSDGDTEDVFFEDPEINVVVHNCSGDNFNASRALSIIQPAFGFASRSLTGCASARVSVRLALEAPTICFLPVT